MPVGKCIGNPVGPDVSRNDYKYQWKAKHKTQLFLFCVFLFISNQWHLIKTSSMTVDSIEILMSADVIVVELSGKSMYM